MDVTGKEPRAAVEAALPPETAGDLYRILLTGETGEGGAGAAAIQEALADRFYALEVRDRTRMAEDLWRRAEETPSGACFSGSCASGGSRRRRKRNGRRSTWRPGSAWQRWTTGIWGERRSG